MQSKLSFWDLFYTRRLRIIRAFCIFFQRYQYHEAFQVNLILQKAEQGYISENSVGEDVLSRMKSTSHWRAGLVVSYLKHFPPFIVVLLVMG